ncbi:MAG: PKD domain-containing protein [Prolixibacteraceae bacterium]
MKKFVVIITILLFAGYGFAQSPFVVAWTGNGTDHMTINVLNAKLGGVNLDTNDEIAVFDGSICVGLARLSKPMAELNFDVTISVSKDEGTGNGYTPGHTIVFKYWDSSAAKVIPSVSPVYYNTSGNPIATAPTFAVGESVFVKLTSEVAINHAPVSNAGPDQTVNELATVVLDGSGSSDPDGNTITYSWVAPAGITLSSSSAAKPSFTAPDVNADTPYKFSLTVNDGQINSSIDEVIITVKQVNTIPVARAGSDQSVSEGSAFTFDGSASYDPDGDAITYKWTAPSGITLSSTTVAKPGFTAPEVTTNTPYIFSLVVNDGKANSAVDQVIITVNQINKAPVANAGPDANAQENKTYQLNGSLSGDPDNNPVSYSWTAPAGITLSSANVANPSFLTPDVVISTAYTFSLVVNDGFLNSSPDQVVITIMPNQIPVANAGADQTVYQGKTVSLNGSLSSDANNDQLSYAWTAPANITLTNANSAYPQFVSPMVSANTDLIFKLTVNDGQVDSQEDQVIVRVLPNQAPAANAGNDFSANESSSVTLNGTASSDPESNSLSFLWTAPSGITLQNANTAQPQFIAPEVSQDTPYSFSLTVNDGTLSSQSDQVIVTVKQVNKTPVANAGPDQYITEGLQVTLDGSLSSDTDNDALTYNWSAPSGIILSSATTPKPTFTAPDVTKDTEYTISLTVSDGKIASLIDQVKITVKKVNQKPLAKAGADFSANEGTTVSLDGSGSTDPDNDPISYLWVAPSGITLSSATTAKPTFTAPEVQTDKTFAFTLTVNDGSENSVSDEVVVTVKQVNKTPVADAGPAQSVNEKITYTLDGTGSSDPDGDALTYKWTSPSGIILSSETVAKPTFITPEITANTQYTFTLVVNDGKVSSPADQVVITVKKDNYPPVANAGADQTVNEGALVTLNGKASTDPENDALIYKWTAPAEIKLSSATAAIPTFTAPEVLSDTKFNIGLVVNDGSVDSKSDELVITVKQVNKAPLFTRVFRTFANEHFEFILEAFDIDNDPTTFVIANLPDSLKLKKKSASSAILSGIFTEANLGTNLYNLTLSDATHTSQETIAILVAPTDHAPYVKDSIRNISVNKNSSDLNIDLYTVFADDDQMDTLTFSVSENINSALVKTKITDSKLNLSFTPENFGYSIIQITAKSNGKTATTVFILEVKNLTGFKLQGNDSGIQVFPNPTNGNVRLKFSKIPETDIPVTIFNSTGKAIFKTSASSSEKVIDLKYFPAGMYFIRVDQDIPKTFKVIRE